MTVLIDKLGSFLFHVEKRGEAATKQMFQYVSPEQLQIYNKKLELTIAMLILLSKAIL